MKTHKIILIISIIFLLYSCSAKEKKITIIEEDNLELQMIESFEKGYEALNDGDILFAAKRNLFKVLEYPVYYKKRTGGEAKGGDSLMGKLMLSIRTFKFIISLKKKLYGNNNT